MLPKWLMNVLCHIFIHVSVCEVCIFLRLVALHVVIYYKLLRPIYIYIYILYNDVTCMWVYGQWNLKRTRPYGNYKDDVSARHYTYKLYKTHLFSLISWVIRNLIRNELHTCSMCTPNNEDMLLLEFTGNTNSWIIAGSVVKTTLSLWAWGDDTRVLAMIDEVIYELSGALTMSHGHYNIKKWHYLYIYIHKVNTNQETITQNKVL